LKTSSNRSSAARINARSEERVKLRSLFDSRDAGSVDRQQLATIEIEPSAQQHELAEHRFEGDAIVASEVGERLEVGLQAAKQPDDFDVAATLALQPSARSDPVEVAVDVELQQIARRVARTTRRFRGHPREPRRHEVQPIDEGIDEPHRIVGVDVIVNRLRQQQKLVSSESGDVSHARF
jgi:hypothetical protein